MKRIFIFSLFLLTILACDMSVQFGTSPISSPTLAGTSDSGAALPAGGIPYPDANDPNADWASYYISVTEVLSATPAEAFTPTLDQLDALIRSMRITQE